MSATSPNSKKQDKGGFSLDALDSSRSQPETPHRGTDKIKKAFTPLFEFFRIQQTGNIFIDFELLAKAIEDPKSFSQRIFETIFEMYDADGSGEIDIEELETLLMDIGQATGDVELRNLSKEKMEKIMRDVDTDQSGSIDKAEFIKYMLSDFWDEEKDDDRSRSGSTSSLKSHPSQRVPHSHGSPSHQ